MWFKRRKRTASPGQLETAAATRVAAVLEQHLLAALSARRVTANSQNLHLSLIFGTVALLRDVLTTRPWSMQVREVGLANDGAIAGGYLQAIGHRLWDAQHAFASDPDLSRHVGLSYSAFFDEFVGATQVPDEMMRSLVASAEELFADAGGADFRPVMDRQTFDLLQTLTDGRFTAEHWAKPVVELEFATAFIQGQRLDMLKIVKEQMGHLHRSGRAEILSWRSQGGRPRPDNHEFRARYPGASERVIRKVILHSDVGRGTLS